MRQFLPAIAVYGRASIYLATGWSDRDIGSEAWRALARTITGFCTLPLMGSIFSVQRWNFFRRLVDSLPWSACCPPGWRGLLEPKMHRSFHCKLAWPWRRRLFSGDD